MPYTTDGHWYGPGERIDPGPDLIARCGGLAFCSTCRAEADGLTTISISGSSDDLIDVRGCDGADEFTVYSPGPAMWRGDLIAPGGVMRVHAVLDESGCWAFAVSQANDSAPFPPWHVKIQQHPETGNSVLVEISAPAATRLTNVWPHRPTAAGG